MPAFNECDGLGNTVHATLPHLAGISFEIIIVDDGSTDGTWQTIRQLAKEIPSVRGVRFSRNFGHQAALMAGLMTSRGRGTIMMDSDGQHPPEVIPQMVQKWKKGAMVVQTLRSDIVNVGVLKKITSKSFYRLFSWLADTPIPAGSADYRLMDQSVVNLIINHPRSGLFLRGFVPWTGFKTDFIEFLPNPRTSGTTKYTPLRMFGFARQGIMRFSTKPLRLATFLGGLTCAVSLAYLAYVLVTRLFIGGYQAGWASIAGLLSLLGGIQLIVMGILGEYIGAIFETQLDRPVFVIEEHLGATSRAGAPTFSVATPVEEHLGDQTRCRDNPVGKKR